MIFCYSNLCILGSNPWYPLVGNAVFSSCGEMMVPNFLYGMTANIIGYLVS